MQPIKHHLHAYSYDVYVNKIIVEETYFTMHEFEWYSSNAMMIWTSQQ